MLKILVATVAVLTLVAIGVAIANSRATADIGLQEGKLLPCPDRPNCVSSQAPTDPTHFVQPLAYSTSPEEAVERLREIVAAMPRAKLVEQRSGYLHFTVTSALFRFVDDVEFLAEDGTGKIQMRSKSRLGYSDLGVNRKRIEEIRSRFAS